MNDAYYVKPWDTRINIQLITIMHRCVVANAAETCSPLSLTLTVRGSTLVVRI